MVSCVKDVCKVLRTSTTCKGTETDFRRLCKPQPRRIAWPSKSFQLHRRREELPEYPRHASARNCCSQRTLNCKYSGSSSSSSSPSLNERRELGPLLAESMSLGLRSQLGHDAPTTAAGDENYLASMVSSTAPLKLTGVLAQTLRQLGTGCALALPARTESQPSCVNIKTRVPNGPSNQSSCTFTSEARKRINLSTHCTRTRINY